MTKNNLPNEPISWKELLAAIGLALTIIYLLIKLFGG